MAPFTSSMRLSALVDASGDAAETHTTMTGWCLGALRIVSSYALERRVSSRIFLVK